VTDPAYEERYCAFVDILGFGDLVKGEASPIRIHALLKQIHAPHAGNEERTKESDFKAQNISDAVALSTVAISVGLEHLFYVLEDLATNLLFNGYFVRGAIAKGNLYHDDKMVFGPALVDAYTLETTIADYPRIMVPRVVFKDAQNVWDKGYKKHIRQASDGPFHVHVLRQLEELVNAMNIPGATDTDRLFRSDLVYFTAIGTQIQKRLRQAVDRPHHFRKVQWFARYFNDCLPHGYKKIPPIKGAGLEPIFVDDNWKEDDWNC